MAESSTEDTVEQRAASWRVLREHQIQILNAGLANLTGAPMINPELIREIADVCTAKGWREDGQKGSRNGHQFGAYVALAHSELSEMLEAYRDKVWSSERQIVGPACAPCRQDYQAKTCGHHVPKPLGVGPEAADAIIRILDMCDLWGIDINYEIHRVLTYNWTREYRHGGRQL